MEGKKSVGSSSSSSSPSSSFTSELFGSKESSSSTGVFGSIFAPSSKVLGRESLRAEVTGRKQYSGNESWSTKSAVPDGMSKRSEGESHSMPNSDISSIYQEQRVQPCHLSSSIYYGGQDIYSHPSTQSSGLNSFKKDGGEDDSGCASRGNWWQGSLYY